MRLRNKTLLACDAATAWREERKISHWLAMSWPLRAFDPLEPPAWPVSWTQDQDLLVRSRLFGLLPLGRQRIRVVEFHEGSREIVTEEHGSAIRRWSHKVQIRAVDQATCRYCDRIDLEAGVLTLPLWLFAAFFYRLRHSRWRIFARKLRCGRQRRSGE